MARTTSSKTWKMEQTERDSERSSDRPVILARTEKLSREAILKMLASSPYDSRPSVVEYIQGRYSNLRIVDGENCPIKKENIINVLESAGVVGRGSKRFIHETLNDDQILLPAKRPRHSSVWNRAQSTEPQKTRLSAKPKAVKEGDQCHQPHTTETEQHGSTKFGKGSSSLLKTAEKAPCVPSENKNVTGKGNATPSEEVACSQVLKSHCPSSETEGVTLTSNLLEQATEVLESTTKKLQTPEKDSATPGHEDTRSQELASTQISAVSSTTNLLDDVSKFLEEISEVLESTGYRPQSQESNNALPNQETSTKEWEPLSESEILESLSITSLIEDISECIEDAAQILQTHGKDSVLPRQPTAPKETGSPCRESEDSAQTLKAQERDSALQTHGTDTKEPESQVQESEALEEPLTTSMLEEMSECLDDSAQTLKSRERDFALQTHGTDTKEPESQVQKSETLDAPPITNTSESSKVGLTDTVCPCPGDKWTGEKEPRRSHTKPAESVGPVSQNWRIKGQESQRSQITFESQEPVNLHPQDRWTKDKEQQRSQTNMQEPVYPRSQYKWVKGQDSRSRQSTPICRQESACLRPRDKITVDNEPQRTVIFTKWQEPTRVLSNDHVFYPQESQRLKGVSTITYESACPKQQGKWAEEQESAFLGRKDKFEIKQEPVSLGRDKYAQAQRPACLRPQDKWAKEQPPAYLRPQDKWAKEQQLSYLRPEDKWAKEQQPAYLRPQDKWAKEQQFSYLRPQDKWAKEQNTQCYERASIKRQRTVCLRPQDRLFNGLESESPRVVSTQRQWLRPQDKVYK